MRETRYTVQASPIGPLVLAGAGERLACIGLPAGKGAVTPKPDWLRDDAAFVDARAQLGAYFDGRLNRFDLNLDPRGTPFQLAVWQALTEIPPGETISYGELARRIAERVGRCLDQAGLTADRIDALFLTGGSTGLPHVRAALTAGVPHARVVDGDTFGSVGTGLTIEAARRAA